MIKRICGLLIVFLMVLTFITSSLKPSLADGCDIPEDGTKPPLSSCE